MQEDDKDLIKFKFSIKEKDKKNHIINLGTIQISKYVVE